jgi:hypothetical protein
MIRNLLQSVLPIALAPLLVAQQVPQTVPAPDGKDASMAHLDLTVPADAHISWTSPDAASLGNVRRGEPAEFVLDKDLIAGSKRVVPAGVPVFGVVVKVVHSSRFKGRDGQIFVGMTQVVSGSPTKIVIRCPNPADRVAVRQRTTASNGLKGAVIGGIIVGVVLILIAGANFDR